MAPKERRPSSLSNLTSRIAEDFGKGHPNPAPVGNRPSPAPSQLMQFSADYRKTAEELEKLKKDVGKCFKLHLTDLVSSPYQLGSLNEARVQGLVDNLRLNPLSSPVVVRASGDEGKYELVAGHHRTEAFRRLGREEIDAVLVDFSDDEAERAVFYDNLFAPSLTDHDKYLGFARRLRSKGMSQRELAEEAGVSQTLISFLFSFEKLPSLVQNYIVTESTRFSSRAFYALSGYAAQHDEESLLHAAKLLAEGAISLSDLEAGFPGTEGRDDPAKKPRATSASEKLVITRDNKAFAEVVRKGTKLTVRFKSGGELDEWQERLVDFLKS